MKATKKLTGLLSRRRSCSFNRPLSFRQKSIHPRRLLGWHKRYGFIQGIWLLCNPLLQPAEPLYLGHLQLLAGSYLQQPWILQLQERWNRPFHRRDPFLHHQRKGSFAAQLVNRTLRPRPWRDEQKEPVFNFRLCRISSLQERKMDSNSGIGSRICPLAC